MTTNLTYSWGSLVNGTTYGWRVEATNGSRTATSGTWYFRYDTAAPQCFSFSDNPDPLTMGQTFSGSPVARTCTWTPAEGGTYATLGKHRLASNAVDSSGNVANQANGRGC